MYHCGAHSRSQRTAQLWFALIWWSKRTSVFQSVRSSAIEKSASGRDRKHARPVRVVHLALQAEEEVRLVPDDRPAEDAAPLALRRGRLRQVPLS